MVQESGAILVTLREPPGGQNASRLHQPAKCCLQLEHFLYSMFWEKRVEQHHLDEKAHYQREYPQQL